MDCSTIIVSYNTFELTCAAVQSALEAASGLAHEVIVVDNNSPDHSATHLRSVFAPETYPNVHIIANVENRGFSKANNQGAALAQGRVLFFLNPDTLVYGQSIATLYTFLLTHPEAGAVGPRVFNKDGTDQSSTSPLPTLRSIFFQHFPVATVLRGQDAIQGRILETTQPVEIIQGCAIALRREVFDEIGGWDESYFLYSEETELCLRLQQAGYINYFVREAEILHYGGASSLSYYAEQQIVQQRSALQFLKRHYPWLYALINRVLGIVGFGLRSLVFPVLEKTHPASSSRYSQRGQAAQMIFRWYLFDYS